MRHVLVTRLLHLLLAAAIVTQLAVTQIMQVPRPGRTASPIGAVGFTVHEWVGLSSMAILVLFWLWLTVRRVGTAPGRLFPWLSRRRLAELREDVVVHVQAARRLALPDPEQSDALSSALHGLGLLIALVMASTGTVGWLIWDQSASMTGVAHTIFEVHAFTANLMWGYVILHVGVAVLHELYGHRLLRRMAPVLP